MDNITMYIFIIILICIILFLLKDKILEQINEKFLLNNNNGFINTISDIVLNSRQQYINNHRNNALDRYINPITYPYKSMEDYKPTNLVLPPQVIGCGSRNLPCSMGSQIPVIATSPLLDFTNNNIAHNNIINTVPINISTRGPEGLPQQVGTIYKINSTNNEVLPLFGRKKYPSGYNNWEYYTINLVILVLN